MEIPVVPKPVDASDTYETIYDDVLSNGHRIRTFINKPKRPGKHPVLFWIQGINASTIDFPLTVKNYICPFLKTFADDGYVIFRVEKTGVGDSEGGPARLVGYDEEMDIYRQALKSLAHYDFVDRDNVFVFGHSMGGCTAPLVCAEIPVKGIVTYGTVSMSWLEWEVRSPRILSVLGGQTRAQVDKEVRQVTQFYNYLFTEKRTVAWIKENRPELAEFATQQSPDGVMLGDRSIRYMQEVNDKNFCEFWAKLGKTRVLALFGEYDWISLREDQTQVAEAVNAANPGMAEFKEVPQSDHIFNKCTSMPDSFARWGKPGAEFNPTVVQMTKDWIEKLRAPTVR
jgi:pimeloyl-ACP methyl ester carboxylesterase